MAACPSGALTMVETGAGYVWAGAAAGHDCVHCGLCLRVCPSRGESAGSVPSLAGALPGPVRAGYWGRASEAQTCQDGSSGGVVTALLSSWFEAGEIEAALVARWSPTNPLRAEAYWAHSAAELKPSQKSKYCTIPLLSCFAAGAAGEPSPQSRIAVVGLPCQIQALTKLREQLRLPRIVATIGLFCDRVLSYHVVDELLDEAGVQPTAVEEFEYRHKGLRGWPGDVLVRLSGARPQFLDRSRRMRLKEYYTPTRCRLCPDKFNSLADLACGDGYGGPTEARGLSTVLVRSEAGEALLAMARERLELKPFDAAAFCKAHHTGDRLRDVAGYLAAYQTSKPAACMPLPKTWQEDLPACDADASGPYADALSYSMLFEEAATVTEARALARARQAQFPPPGDKAGLRGVARKLLRLLCRPPSSP